MATLPPWQDMNLRELTKRYGRGIGLSINAVRGWEPGVGAWQDCRASSNGCSTSGLTWLTESVSYFPLTPSSWLTCPLVIPERHHQRFPLLPCPTAGACVRAADAGVAVPPAQLRRAARRHQARQHPVSLGGAGLGLSWGTAAWSQQARLLTFSACCSTCRATQSAQAEGSKLT